MNSEPLLHHCLEADIPSSHEVVTIPYVTGLEPEPLPLNQGNNSVVLTMTMAVIVAVVLVMRHSARFMQSSMQSLLTVRQRENAFDEHTLNENAIIVVLNIAVALSGAILLYATAGLEQTVSSVTFARLFGLSVLFIAGQYVMYNIIGYVFTSRNLTRQWLSGFSSAQSFLGLALLFPASAALFYPGAATSLAITAAIMYAVARICFICKGFRIFFDNIFSLVYFILYLCSAEIIPILLVYRKAVDICC